MTYRCVLFDFDGTLGDTYTWFVSAMRSMADDFGIRQLDPDEVEALRSVKPREVLERLGLPSWKLPKLARLMRRRMAEDIANVHLFEGAAGLIEALSEHGLTLAIVSSNAEANIRSILGLSLAERFADFDAGVSLFGKAPRLRKVMKRLKVTPSEVIYVGDELRDLEAARKVGIACGLVTWGFTHPESIAEAAPDAVFATPTDLVNYLVQSSETSPQGPQGAL